MTSKPDASAATSTADGRAERLARFRRIVMRATFSSLLVPGAGHWMAAQPVVGALVLAAEVAVALVVAWHLAGGISIFESSLGSFVFGALLRGGITLYAFAVIDAYFATIAPGDRAGILRRRALVLNLLLPGSGYLLIGAWFRAATGLLVLSMIVYFAGLRYHRYVDLVLVGAQLIMAAAVYQHLRIAEAEAADPTRPPAPPLDPVAPAQIAALLVATAALIGCAYVVHLRMPDYDFARIDEDQIQIRPSPAGIQLRVPPLQLTMTAWGDGWIAEKPGSGMLFSAQHERNATLRLGAELILPFVRTDRYVEHIRRRMVAAGFTHKKSKRLSLNGTSADQLWFTRSLGRGQNLDQWTVAVPRGHYALLLLIECNRLRCKEILPTLERTRDSLKIEPTRP